MDLYEAIEIICDDYCKYPDIESGNKLADICDKCPMNNCEDLRWADRKTKQTERGGEWIPCSERLPDDDELMLVNYVDPRPEAMDIWIGWHEMENVWYIDGEMHSNELGNEVIAWMPLPKPMKGADDE